MQTICIVADLDKRLEKRGKRGVEIGGKRLFALTYADGLVLLARKEGGMRLMMGELEEHLKEKGLEVNSGKSKIMIFGKRVGKGRKRKWRWRNDKIEEIGEYKYLGFTFQRNREMEAHLREKVKNAEGVIREVWGMGKRWFKGGKSKEGCDCLMRWCGRSCVTEWKYGVGEKERKWRRYRKDTKDGFCE